MSIRGLHKIILYILSVSMSFYLAKLTQYSPVYIVYLALAPACAVFIASSLRYKVPFDNVALLFLLIWVTLLNIEHVVTGDYINFFIGVLAYLYFRSLARDFNSEYWMRLVEIVARVTILVMGVDTIYRLSHPMMPTLEASQAVLRNEDLWFYPYKFGTLMFADSNTTGLVSMVVFFALIGSRYSLKKVAFKWDSWLLLLLVLLSLSRSALLATLVGMFYVAIKFDRKGYHKFLAYASLVVVVASLSYAFSFIYRSQGSFISKFTIANLVYEYLINSDLYTILTGVGVGESAQLFGIYTHIIAATYFVEAGVISLIIFFVFVVFYLKKNGSVIMLPFLIASSSYFLYLGAPFLFIPLALYANIIYRTRVEARVQ